MAVEPLLQRHLADEIVDADLLRLFHHSVDFDRPGTQLERLRRFGDAFARAEFIEVVVVGIDLFVGDRTIKREFLIALDGINILGGIGQIADALSERGSWDQRERAGAHKQAAAVEEQMLRCGKPLGNFPTAAMNDMHGRPPDCRHYRPGRNHRQVTATPRSCDGGCMSSVPSCAAESCRSAGPGAWASQTDSLGRFGSRWPAIYGFRERSRSPWQPR